MSIKKYPDTTQKLHEQLELENYAQSYFRYTKLVQDQADAMRHNPQEMNAAYARVAPEGVLELEELTHGVHRRMQAILDDLARWAEIELRNFDDLSISLAWSLRVHKDVIQPHSHVLCFLILSTAFVFRFPQRSWQISDRRQYCGR